MAAPATGRVHSSIFYAHATVLKRKQSQPVKRQTAIVAALVYINIHASKNDKSKKTELHNKEMPAILPFDSKSAYMWEIE